VQNALARSQGTGDRAAERLSSGLRINRASDDAAGLAIASSLSSKTRIYTTAIRNANDGISALSIADAALGSLGTISQREAELAEQAANGVYSSEQRRSIDREAQKLKDEWNRIISTTSFNGISLLDGSTTSIDLQIGIGTNEQLSVALPSTTTRVVGDGTFGSAQFTALGSDSNVLADLNGDGSVDLAVQNHGSNTLEILLGDGAGNFAPFSGVPGNISGEQLVAGDINNDGKIDIITQNYSYLGNGDGTFGARGASPISGSALSVADFTGDGVNDILGSSGTDLVVYSGAGNGTFSATTTLAAASAFTEALVGDINGDGTLDIIRGDNSDFTAYVNNGNGTFSSTDGLVNVTTPSLDAVRDIAPPLTLTTYDMPGVKSTSM
jgi:flagellin